AEVGGGTDDVIVYENVVAMIETAGKDGQVHVGTLVKVGDSWRAVDAPVLTELSNRVAGGFFFTSGPYRGPEAATIAGPDAGPSETVQKLMEELSSLDQQI